MNKFYIILSDDEWIAFEKNLIATHGSEVENSNGWDDFLINLGCIVGVDIDFLGSDDNKNFIRYLFSSEEQKLRFMLTYL